MNPALHATLIAIHIGAGIVALICGAAAVGARKGGRVHGWAGTVFCASMLLLGVSAAILEPYRPQPGSPLAGLFVCYFVATAWVTVLRRDGVAGRFEIGAGAVALGTAALMLWAAFSGASRTPVGQGPIFIVAGLCLLAGLLDLNVVLRGRLTPVQRISRHVWRICVAFFIATGSFFLGQQDVMPAALRGSPVLFLLAFAPFAVMLFWLARLRFGTAFARLRLRAAALPVAGAAGQPSA